MQTLDMKVDRSSIGSCILIYGDTNSGKTTSVLTAEDPILHVNTEPKDPRTIFQQFEHGKNISLVRPEGFEDLMQSLNRWKGQANEGKFPFKTLFFDSLTFGQDNFRKEVEDSRFAARGEEARGVIDLRFEKPDWGIMSSLMGRVTYLLNQFSMYGITVIATAQATHDWPKWGGGVKTAPALFGQDFPKTLHGYFHFIGYIEEPFKFGPEMELILPRVAFHSNDGSFMARCNSLELAKKGPAPLDWGRIVKVIRGG